MIADLVIGVFAVGIVLYNSYRFFVKKKKGCGCGCDGCNIKCGESNNR